MMINNKQISLIGKEHAFNDLTPLSPEAFRDLVKRRALSILHISPDEKEWENNEEIRRKTEKDIYEKIHKDNNLLPIDFLYKGAEVAKAICRITTPSGAMGTGFLIDNGVIMTNHHVIEDKNIGAGSIAEFYYEEGKNSIRVKLNPHELFITSPMEDLDFTIIACENIGIEDIKPIKLTRNPATITRGEYVNIIQHPAGRKKEIALQDNTVSYVYDKAIHYITDTEPGSSGSAVFNNKWQLVALHHAGWFSDQSSQEAVNEGIRISVIVSHLISQAHTGDSGASKIIGSLEDTSPYLGFYDVNGLIRNNNDISEIEIPTFSGDRLFADIGFWNIEHFNNGVDDQRVKEVAKVISNLSMDALGLIEVEKEAMNRLVKALKNEGANMDYVYLDTNGPQDLAILYDISTTTAEIRSDINNKYKSLLEETTPSGQSAFPKKREPLFAKCKIKEEGKDIEFLIIVVHLKAMRDIVSTKRRKLAANIIALIIEDLLKDSEFKHLPIILGGDFNDDINSTSLMDIIKSPSLKTLTDDDARAGHSSYLKDPFSLIDHILVSKDVNIAHVSGDDTAIVRLDKSVNDFVQKISDHAPLVMRLLFKDTSEIMRHTQNNSIRGLENLHEEKDLEKALLRLKLNKSKFKNNISYYDEEKDKLSVNDYYRSINFIIGNCSQLYQNIHELLARTHKNTLPYNRSRIELYSDVDLRENGEIKSIYSGKNLDPESLIREDKHLEQERVRFIENVFNNEIIVTDEHKETILEEIENKFQFNIEHVVPQSWFGKLSPMVGDLHHLFISEKECNSFRSNIPYFDFEDYNPESYSEVIKNQCGKRGGNIKFEPESGKGEAARAVLYFLLRYPNKIKNERKKQVDINLLIRWHKKHPITLHEKHRNRAIFNIQGNRNPLIDFPDCVDLINFSLGL
ncbi:endonuclease [Bacillus safensis]|uniref:endonuclease n=1 Tax=Bacillus TaxID=1386 RepID=UPI00203BABEF|nr:endonuclease [Bacillus safensis]MCY7448427.1 endonuclease [Bacillus safensis]MCY7458032.1 endonuclease [Bacillus safensis]MDP4565282.1 endonuclease [Bacillus safensis]MEC0922659.1 endonuclease [Bacillus safensis]MEC0995740.1 endonuclease [Bacillus safensis]